MQVTEQPPIAAGEFERVLDARLIMSVVAAGIMSFVDVVVEAAMNVTFPALMDEFGVNTATVQWMTTAYLLVLAVIMPPVVSQPTLRHPPHLHGGQSSLHLGHRMRLLRRLVPPCCSLDACSRMGRSAGSRAVRGVRPHARGAGGRVRYGRGYRCRHARGLRASCLRGGSGALLCGDHGYAVLSPVERGSSVRPSRLAYGTCAHGASWDRMSGIAKAAPLFHTMLYEARA